MSEKSLEPPINPLKWSCMFCYKMSTKMMRCSKCGTATYCNKECQSKHWKIHKLTCLDREDDIIEYLESMSKFLNNIEWFAPNLAKSTEILNKAKKFPMIHCERNDYHINPESVMTIKYEIYDIDMLRENEDLVKFIPMVQDAFDDKEKKFVFFLRANSKKGLGPLIKFLALLRK